MQMDDVAALTEALVELVRKEVPQVAASGRNWKLVLQGSQAGDVRMIVEQHADVVQRCHPLQK
jgi:hypothetical protein